MAELKLRRVKLPYNPSRLLNRKKSPRKRYVLIAEQEGKQRALEVLEQDYRDGMLSYTTYRDIKKFLLNDVEEVEPVDDYKKLLLDILEVAISKKTWNKKEIAKALEIDIQTLDNVFSWGINNYKELIQAVYSVVKSKTS